MKQELDECLTVMCGWFGGEAGFRGEMGEELYFYSKIFGLTPSNELESVHIENLE